MALDASVPGLLRADRVEITPLNFLVRHFTGNTGRWGDLGLFEDGTVVYLPVVDVLDKPWVASLDDLGQPGDVSEAFVRWRAVGFWQRPSTIRNTSMTIRLAGETKILRFSGIVPETSRFWNVITKAPLPHHLGLVPKTAWVVKLTIGAGSRADSAATWWREAIAAWHQSHLNCDSADVAEPVIHRAPVTLDEWRENVDALMLRASTDPSVLPDLANELRKYAAELHRVGELDGEAQVLTELSKVRLAIAPSDPDYRPSLSLGSSPRPDTTDVGRPEQRDRAGDGDEPADGLKRAADFMTRAALHKEHAQRLKAPDLDETERADIYREIAVLRKLELEESGKDVSRFSCRNLKQTRRSRTILLVLDDETRALTVSTEGGWKRAAEVKLYNDHGQMIDYAFYGGNGIGEETHTLNTILTLEKLLFVEVTLEVTFNVTGGIKTIVVRVEGDQIGQF
jgi:hypothetical protein